MAFQIIQAADEKDYDILEISGIKGLNTRDQPLARKPDEWNSLQNALLVGRGVEKRQGSALYGSAQTGSKVVGLGNLEQDSGLTPLMTVNQTLYKYTGGAWAAGDKTNYTANLDTFITSFNTKSGSSLDSGTSTSGSTIYLLEDTGKSWTPGQHQGRCVVVNGEVKYITDNTATVLFFGDKGNSDVNADYQSKAYNIFAIAPHAIICNGTDSVQKYNLTTTTALDGTHITSGKALPIATVLTPHQGRLWYAEGSGNDNDRVWLTDVGLAENITVDTNLNINLQFYNDGDRVMNVGSLPLGTGSVALVTKQRSTHVVEGDNILNYTSRPILKAGSIARKSFAIGGGSAFFLGERGVHEVRSDQNEVLPSPVPISRDIEDDINAMSSAQRQNACGIVFDNRYYLQVGGTIWYYDIEASLREQKAVWVNLDYSWDFNVFAVIDNVLYAGDQTNGQAYQLHTTNADNSEPFTMVLESADISLPGRPQLWVERLEIMAETQTSTILQFQVSTDGGSYGTIATNTLDNTDGRYVFPIQKRCYSFKMKLTESGSNAAARIIYPLRVFFKVSEYGDSGTKG